MSNPALSPEKTRIETDSIGEIAVPFDKYWGAQTQRAVENFPISGGRIDARLIRALALIKAEAAAVNAKSDEVDAVRGKVGEICKRLPVYER